MAQQTIKHGSRRTHVVTAVLVYAGGAALLFIVATMPTLGGATSRIASQPSAQAEQMPAPIAAVPAPAKRQVAVEEPATVQKGAGAPLASPTSLEEVAVQLQDRFNRDGRPTASMIQTQNAFFSLFSGTPLTGAALKELECRTTICRAEVVFDDRDSDDSFARYAFLDPATRVDRGLAVAVPTRLSQGDGKVAATVYMYRDEELERIQATEQ